MDINHDGCISKNEFPFPAGEGPVFEYLAGLSQADGDCVADQISLADFQAFTTFDLTEKIESHILELVKKMNEREKIDPQKVTKLE